jgi:hypothetical protein
MMVPMRRSPVSVLSLLAVCSLAGSLVGCSLIPGSSSDLEDALEVIPADATTVTFVGRAAAAERLDVEVETGADDRELGRYLQAVDEAGVATRLTSYLGVMGDAALSDADIVWEVSGSGGDDDGPWTVWKTDDDLDLDDVGDDLADAGYEESETGGERRFRAELAAADPETSLVGDRYPVAVMGDVVLVPDEHLVLTGPDVEATLDVVQDDEDSLVDTQDLEEVAGAEDDVELARLRREIDCAEALRLGPVNPQQVAEQAELLGVGDLARPDSTAFLVHGDDGATTTVLEFGDDETAEADAEARQAWLEESMSPPPGRQALVEDVTWDLETDGSMVRIDHEIGKDGPTSAIAAGRAEDPFALCAPES